MKYSILILLFLSSSLLAQSDTLCIKINFLYGSRPLKKHKDTESKYFGGIHGGHVTIEVDSMDYGFNPYGSFHIIGRKKNHHSVFDSKPTRGQPAYGSGWKYASFYIPVTREKHEMAKQILKEYAAKTPYDYAFLGMRCASATHDVLAQLGVLEQRGRQGYIWSSFYPKKLRHRLFALAQENNYRVERQEGRETRKWERD